MEPGRAQALWAMQETTRGPAAPRPSQWTLTRTRPSWMHRKGQWVWKHNVSGQTVLPYRVASTDGGYRLANPEVPGQLSVLMGVKSARRKRFRRAALRFAIQPGTLGFTFGAVAPKFLSTFGTAAATATVALAGYIAPQGSWLRRFSIGAGMGAGARASKWVYGQLTEPGPVRGALGIARVAKDKPWSHWLPVVGQFFQTIDPQEASVADKERLRRALKKLERRRGR